MQILKAEHEIREAFLMQDMVVDAKQELHERRFHRHSELVSYPEKWDWREKSFVTDVRKQRESIVHKGLI